MPITLDFAPKGKKTAGLYVISPQHPSVVNQYKVGRSVDLRTRLNGYSICFPKGFYIYGIIILKNTTPKNKLLERTIDAEKKLFTLLDLNGAQPIIESDVSCESCEALPSHKQSQNVRIKSEWINIELDRLKAVLSCYGSLHKSIINSVITDFKEPYVHNFTIDNEEVDVLKEKRGWDLVTVPAYRPWSRRSRIIKPTFKNEVMLKGSL